MAFKIGKVLEAEAVVFMGFRIVGAKMKRILQRRAAAVVGVGVFVILSLPTVAAAQQTIVEYTIPTASSAPAGMTPGPDGAMWFIENGGNNVGRMTPDGGVTNEYPIPTASSAPNAIVDGPDGDLWFLEHAGNKIGRITPGGVFTEFPIPTANSGLRSIVVGPGRRTVVHRANHQQDRADHHRGRHHRIRRSDSGQSAR